MTERRTLLVTERTVQHAEREGYVQSMRETQQRCANAGVHFWIFEHENDNTRFLEFAEAKADARFETLGVRQPTTTEWHAVELR